MSFDARTWTQVPAQIRELVKQGSPLAGRLRSALARLKHIAPLADPGYHCAYLNPDTKVVFFSFSDSDDERGTAWKKKENTWKKELKVPGVSEVIAADGTEVPPPKDKGPWLRIKAAAVEMKDLFGPVAKAYGLVPGQYLGADSSPLVNTLAGAALTGAAGYGLGWAGEHLLPDRYFEKGKLRRTLGLAGLGLGALPGVYQSIDNLRMGRSPVQSWPPPAEEKAAEDGVEPSPNDHQPIIPRDEFGRVVWSDPYTPIPIRAATVGLVDSAGLARGDSPWVSPADVAQIAASAGSGYLSGLVVGKTLGALAGLRPETQQSLIQLGTWSGILKSIIPTVLGGR